MGQHGGQGGKPVIGDEGVQYGGAPAMKWFAAVCLWVSLMATTLNAQEPQCPCDFEIVTKEIPADVELRLTAFLLKGDFGSRRRVFKYQESTDFLSGMVVDTTHKWFREHAPCGTDKFCVERVTFSHRYFGVEDIGWVVMIIEVKKRKR